jgi:hypothetical protein
MERDHLRNIGVSGIIVLQTKHFLRMFFWIQLADGRNVYKVIKGQAPLEAVTPAGRGLECQILHT